MSSPSFTPPSPSASQHPQVASTTPSSALQTSNNMDAAAVHTTQQFNDLPDDPTQRSTGILAKVLNDKWTESPRRSVLKELLEMENADLLEYYEGRRTGKIEADSFEGREDPVSTERAKQLYYMEYGRIQRVFFEMDYARGFTGRGVLNEAMERPGQIGPRNETIEEIAGPTGGLGYEQADRTLWQAIDEKGAVPSEESKDEEDVGPFGESRDDEDVGPFGELRDEEEVDHLGELMDEDEEQEEDEETEEAEETEEDEDEETKEDEETDVEDMMQLAVKAVAIVSEAPTDTGAASSHTATTFPTELQAPLTFSNISLASTSFAPSRKRARDAEEDEEDNDFRSRQKRRRMDDVLGIVREDANTAQSVGAAMTPNIQQSRKRARGPEDDSSDSTTKKGPKRLRLNIRPREIRNAEMEYVANGPVDAAVRDDSTLANQPALSNGAQGLATVDKVASTEVDTQVSVEEEGPFANDEAHEREDAVVDDKPVPSQTDWNTAHGINSDCANIRVRGMGVYDLAGQSTQLYLPTSRGSPYRPWTEEEKENLRVYIQDYRIGDWEALSQSMGRTTTELQYVYLEIITARNEQAGRSKFAGLSLGYPNLAPPPPPQEPTESTAEEEAASRTAPAEPPKPKQESPVSLRSSVDNEPSEVQDGDRRREIEDGELVEDSEAE